MGSIIDAIILSFFSFSLLWIISICVATLIMIINKSLTLRKRERKE